MIVAVAAIGLVLAGCSKEAETSSTATTTTAASGQPLATAAPVGAKPKTALKAQSAVPGTTGQIAEVKSSVSKIEVFPAKDATSVGSLPNPWLYQGNSAAKIPRVFMVKQDQGAWLEVYTGEDPTGSTTWIKAVDVDLKAADYRVEVTLSTFNLKAFKGDQVIVDAPIAIGSGPRPSLEGLHFLNVLLQVPADSPKYGPYAFGISAYSPDPAVREEFKGGQMGLHGTNDPNSIGKATSNGCIRLSNENISKLATVVPIGTPIVIKA